VPVTLKIEGLQRFAKAVQEAAKGPNHGGPVGAAMKQWGALFRGFTKERFHKFSRGGGDWAPLKPATIRRKQKEKGIGAVAILIKDAILFGGLDPQLRPEKGAIQEDILWGIRVGYGGQAKHEKGGGTIAQIARIHQTGNPAHNLPARPIIVEPPKAVVDRMASLMQAALGKQWGQSTVAG